ncbi:sigma-70 family RNA polymerase sigma factor [Nocardioidaceae bacterium]|nr:sigma-70 family RNA polymerase sigma factor [Nocardioidaceae bacterium]
MEPDWDALVRRHADTVHRVALRLTGDREEAADLTQDTFVRAFTAWDRFAPEHEGAEAAWLRRIATNLFLDGARRRARIRFDALLPDRADRVEEPAGAADLPLHERTLEADVLAALHALSPPFRAAVVLCDIEGVSHDEAAETLGVRVGTVRTRLHRARGQLRDALAHRRTPTRRRWAAPLAMPMPGLT